jgi:eukaryotic-like serine/threonine-protein kinase
MLIAATHPTTTHRIKKVNAIEPPAQFVNSRMEFMDAKEGSMQEVNMKIGRYRVTGELGRGGMGIVYQGEDRLIGRRVAIKTLNEVTPELRERFHIEARSGILSHQNIATVYEVGEHEGTPFIAMEYIEGDSLEKMLHERARLPLLESLSIVEQLCAGLGYAHQHGVVHRDVKPANVLVRPDGRVSIVDFGIARLADQTRQLTKTDTLLGTFHYIAPERLKGEPSDGRGDIWSVGVIFYQMLTGELPFRGSDISSLYRIVNEPYVPLLEHLQDLPKDLSRVFDKALAKQVDARYAIAEEMAFDLQVLAEDLKQDRVSALLNGARRMIDEVQYPVARSALLQAQRIDPTNPDTKGLLADVQARISQMQRGEQLRQLIGQAQDAVDARRWSDAVTFYQQAQSLDSNNELNLNDKLQHALAEKSKQQKVSALWKEADEARLLGDFAKAQGCLGQALKVDSRNTELRNAYSTMMAEVALQQQLADGTVRGAEEVQEPLLSVTERQNQKRQEQPDADAHEASDPKDLPSPEEHATRTIQALRDEPGKQNPRTKARDQRKNADVQLAAQKRKRFADNPDKTSLTIEKALQDLPESNSLIQPKEPPTKDPESAEKEQSPTKPTGELQVGTNISSQSGGLSVLAVKEERQQTVAFSHTRALEETIPSVPKSNQAGKGNSELHTQAQADERNNLNSDQTQVLLTTKPSEDKSALHNGSKESGAGNRQTKPQDPKGSAEEQAAVAKAVAACERAIIAGELDRCMFPLDSLQKQYGKNPGLALARQTCESKRTFEAERVLREALHAAKRQLRDGSAKEALASLIAVKRTLFLGPADAQDEWKQLEIACVETLNARSQSLHNRRLTASGRTRWYVVGGVAAALVCAIAGLTHLRHGPSIPQRVVEKTDSHIPPAPVAAPPTTTTDLEINASPWAKVMDIQNTAGKSIYLDDGNPTTPMRLEEVPIGSYKVTLLGPDGKRQTLGCYVSEMEHLCSADMGSLDIDQLLTGNRP